MGDESQIQRLLAEITSARELVAKGNVTADEKFRLLTEMDRRVSKHGEAIDNLSRRLGRPGASEFGDESERLEALAMLHTKHAHKVPRTDIEHPFNPSEDDVESARLAIKGLRSLMHVTSIDAVPHDQRKALTSFSLGSSGFILPPIMADQVLSCLTDPTDIAGLMNNITISGPSIKYMVDNASLDQAAWACDVDCWSASHTGNLLAGLGELELKPESLRYIVCANRDLLEDSSVNIENWLLQKVNRALRQTLTTAILSGDGQGKPQGLLHPSSGIPVCETSVNTPAGQFTWADLVMLKYEVPIQYHAGARYLMNQRTFALLATLTDAMGRPIMLYPTPIESSQFMLNGSPITIVTGMPDCVAGATPVLFGNLNETYTVVNRKSVTMLQDPYSTGFCITFKFETRVGGGTTCPNASRLLRIR